MNKKQKRIISGEHSLVSRKSINKTSTGNKGDRRKKNKYNNDLTKTFTVRIVGIWIKSWCVTIMGWVLTKDTFNRND